MVPAFRTRVSTRPGNEARRSGARGPPPIGYASSAEKLGGHALCRCFAEPILPTCPARTAQLRRPTSNTLDGFRTIRCFIPSPHRGGALVAGPCSIVSTVGRRYRPESGESCHQTYPCFIRIKVRTVTLAAFACTPGPYSYPRASERSAEVDYGRILRNSIECQRKATYRSPADEPPLRCLVNHKPLRLREDKLSLGGEGGLVPIIEEPPLAVLTAPAPSWPSTAA